MSDINQTLIHETFKRINRSLNIRFEKNSDLFVSKQDQKELKRIIKKSDFKRYSELVKLNKYNSEALIKILIKNSWIIEYPNYFGYKPFSKTIESCNKIFFIEQMEDVVHNKIEVPPCLKEFLMYYYYEYLSLEKKIEILDNRSGNRQAVKICFKSLLDSFETASQYYKTVKKYFKEYSFLYDKEYMYVLDFSSKSIQFQKDILNIIIEEEILSVDNPQWVWCNAIILLKSLSFDKIIEELKRLPDKHPNFRKLINIILIFILKNSFTRDKENSHNYIEKINDLYRHYPASRFALVMACRKIKNFSLECAKSFIHEFKKIEIIPVPVLLEVVNEIENSEGEEDVEIENSKDLYNHIIKGINDEKYQRFISAKIHHKKDYSNLLSDLLLNYGTYEDVQNFYINFLNFRHPHARVIDAILVLVNYLEKNTSLGGFNNKFYDYIEQHHIKDIPKVKDYIFNNNFLLYQKLHGRK